MKKYKVIISVEGVLEIDEPIEANSEDEAIDIAIQEYGNCAFYNFGGDATEIEEDEESEDEEYDYLGSNN